MGGGESGTLLEAGARPLRPPDPSAGAKRAPVVAAARPARLRRNQRRLICRPAQEPQWTNIESSPRLRHTSPPAARRTARGSSGSLTIPTGAGTSTGGRATSLRGGATGMPTPRTTPARPSGTFHTGEHRADPEAPEAQATSTPSRRLRPVVNCHPLPSQSRRPAHAGADEASGIPAARVVMPLIKAVGLFQQTRRAACPPPASVPRYQRKIPKNYHVLCT